MPSRKATRTLSWDLQFWATCLKQSQLWQWPCPTKGHAHMGKFHIKGYLHCLLILVKTREDNSNTWGVHHHCVNGSHGKKAPGQWVLKWKKIFKKRKWRIWNLDPQGSDLLQCCVDCVILKRSGVQACEEISAMWICLTHKGAVPHKPAALPSAEWLHLRLTSQDGQLNQADEADKSSQRTN